MVIIWGTRGMNKDLGVTRQMYHCSHCNSVSNYKVFRVRKWFTLFWIPIFPFSSKYYVTCPVCSYGANVKKQEAFDEINGMMNIPQQGPQQGLQQGQQQGPQQGWQQGPQQGQQQGPQQGQYM